MHSVTLQIVAFLNVTKIATFTENIYWAYIVIFLYKTTALTVFHFHNCCLYIQHWDTNTCQSSHAVLHSVKFRFSPKLLPVQRDRWTTQYLMTIITHVTINNCHFAICLLNVLAPKCQIQGHHLQSKTIQGVCI
jgi:hypothetical protein